MASQLQHSQRRYSRDRSGFSDRWQEHSRQRSSSSCRWRDCSREECSADLPIDGHRSGGGSAGDAGFEPASEPPLTASVDARSPYRCSIMFCSHLFAAVSMLYGGVQDTGLHAGGRLWLCRHSLADASIQAMSRRDAMQPPVEAPAQPAPGTAAQPPAHLATSAADSLQLQDQPFATGLLLPQPAEAVAQPLPAALGKVPVSIREPTIGDAKPQAVLPAAGAAEALPSASAPPAAPVAQAGAADAECQEPSANASGLQEAPPAGLPQKCGHSTVSAAAAVAALRGHTLVQGRGAGLVSSRSSCEAAAATRPNDRHATGTPTQEDFHHSEDADRLKPRAFATSCSAASSSGCHVCEGRRRSVTPEHDADAAASGGRTADVHDPSSCQHSLHLRSISNQPTLQTHGTSWSAANSCQP